MDGEEETSGYELADVLNAFDTGYSDGCEDGFDEGYFKAYREVIMRMDKLGYSPEEISDRIGKDVEFVEDVKDDKFKF